jgi:hypothetical protein
MNKKYDNNNYYCLWGIFPSGCCLVVARWRTDMPGLAAAAAEVEQKQRG